jgi:mono/diheme cytochrome c family protein
MKHSIFRRRLFGLFICLAVSAGAVDASAQNAAPGKSQGSAPEQGGRGDMWDPHWMQRQIWGPRELEPGVQQRMERHWTFMHQGIPEEYLRAANPFRPTDENIAAGRALYDAKCQSCHGETGLGDGTAGRSLSPSPALLAYLIQMPATVDSYLLWSISEGGVAFRTGMPSFKAEIARDDIWRIVTFMRAGFPKAGAR